MFVWQFHEVVDEPSGVDVLPRMHGDGEYIARHLGKVVDYFLASVKLQAAAFREGGDIGELVYAAGWRPIPDCFWEGFAQFGKSDGVVGRADVATARRVDKAGFDKAVGAGKGPPPIIVSVVVIHHNQVEFQRLPFVFEQHPP